MGRGGGDLPPGVGGAHQGGLHHPAHHGGRGQWRGRDRAQGHSADHGVSARGKRAIVICLIQVQLPACPGRVLQLPVEHLQLPARVSNRLGPQVSRPTSGEDSDQVGDVVLSVTV